MGRFGFLLWRSSILCCRSVWRCLRFSSCAARAASRRLLSGCFGEEIFSAGPGRAAGTEAAAVWGGCGGRNRGEVDGAGFGREIVAGMGAAGGAGGGLLGKGAGVPTGMALALETAGFTIWPAFVWTGRGGISFFCSGLTNRLGGRFAGGVASACILARAFWATSLSLIPDHPRSGTGCAIVLTTRFGREARSAGRKSIVGNATTSPRMTGPSVFKSCLLSSRKRSIGWWLRACRSS